MASEKSYADKLGRGNLIKDTVAGFVPVFTPGDTDLTPANFTTFLTTVEHKNSGVETMRGNYSVASGNRIQKVKDIKNLSTRARDYVLSVAAFKPYFATVKRLVKAIKGFRPPKPAPDPNNPNPKKRNQGEQSYADIANNFKALINNLTSIAGYAPTSADLLLPALTIVQGELVTMNTNMGTLAGDLSVTVGERSNLYDGENGLRVKMLAIKAAVKSQYGINSPEYLAVKGIKV
jgi:hypothetical protein